MAEKGLNIAVCVKQVPHSQDLRIDPERGTLIRAGARAVINPPDERAAEVALQLKEKHGGKVTAISMGPPQADAALKELLARGCDDAILLCDRTLAGADTYPTSLTLARTIQKLGAVDLVLCGDETTDSSTGHVGPGIAAHLRLPQATYVSELEFLPDRGVFRARRDLEDGVSVVEFPPPGLATVVLEANFPRVPTLAGKLKARRYPLPTWSPKEIDLPAEWVGLKGSPTVVAKVVAEKGGVRQVQMLNGSAGEAAARLLQQLREQGVLS